MRMPLAPRTLDFALSNSFGQFARILACYTGFLDLGHRLAQREDDGRHDADNQYDEGNIEPIKHDYPPALDICFSSA